MRVLLLKDVYKLGRAGDVKKVADGYGRNFLLPQGLAVLATPGALKQAERISRTANDQRSRLNQELGAVAERLNGLRLTFPVKAGETGKLYGSITPSHAGESIQQATGAKVDKRQIDCQPIKTLGVHKAGVRLTIDLIPEVTVLVHREGESPESADAVAEAAAEAASVGEFEELEAELEAEEAEAEKEAEAPEAGELEASESAKPADILWRPAAGRSRPGAGRRLYRGGWMKEIGRTLREARERLGLTLEEVERNTHIRARHLAAIEKGELETLPSSVQARGFLRTTLSSSVWMQMLCCFTSPRPFKNVAHDYTPRLPPPSPSPGLQSASNRAAPAGYPPTSSWRPA